MLFSQWDCPLFLFGSGHAVYSSLKISHSGAMTANFALTS